MAGRARAGGAGASGEEVAHLYVSAGLSVRQVATQVHLSRRRVSEALREAGVDVANGGRGRRRLNRRVPEPDGFPDLLRQLYTEQRLSSRAIGERLGMAERTVRTRLEELGIPRRTKGGFQREDRQDPDPDVVSRLYVDLGMTADEVAAVLGRSRRAVLRTAHGHGLPVRQPPSVDEEGPGLTWLVDALYLDPLVTETLRRHGVPKVPPFGPIWVRFPEPAPLTQELLRELYEFCGVALAHIELLTGQPAETVRQHLVSWDIPVRPPGGRCPFLHRLMGP